MANKCSLLSAVTKTLSINDSQNSIKIILCVVSGFSREVDEICALLGYFRASSDNLLQTFRNNMCLAILWAQENIGP